MSSQSSLGISTMEQMSICAIFETTVHDLFGQIHGSGPGASPLPFRIYLEFGKGPIIVALYALSRVEGGLRDVTAPSDW